MASNKPVHEAVSSSGILLVVASMLCSTGVAVVLSSLRLFAYAGPDGSHAVCKDLFWIVFWTGLTEGVALMTAVVTYRKLGNRIRHLQGELSDLVRGVLHDIKTPITHIRNSSEQALNGMKKPEDVLPDILESCDTLSEIMSANAEISQVCSGKYDRPAEPTDMAAVARQCAELFGAVAESEGIEFSAAIPDGPLDYPIHKANLQNLINNLLDNAIKFTPGGGKVALSLESTGKKVTLRVSDTGCGIPADMVPHIFERFYRADFSRATPGYGLGLSLVDAIVKACRGRIEVESEPGKGTTVTVALPVA